MVVFEKYWDEETVQKNLKLGNVITGPIRINQKNYEEAFVPHTDGISDVFIEGITLRNRALNGDVVFVQMFPLTKWKISVESLSECSEDVARLIESKLSLEEKCGEDRCDGEVSRANVASKTPEPCHNKSSKTAATGSKSKKGGQKNENHSAKQDSNKFITLEELKGNPPKYLPRSLLDSLEKLDLTRERDDLLPSIFDFKTGLLQMTRTGKVVGIEEKKHGRLGVGTLKLKADKQGSALFSPRDCRMPRIKILPGDPLLRLLQDPTGCKNVLFVAKVTSWGEKNIFPLGALVENIGEAGSVEAETGAILSEFDVDDSPFKEDVLACLPRDLPWKIPAGEFACRRDFRRNVVFTIDPESARDLDDALSCDFVGDGLFEVGVHIADVSYFVEADTSLDRAASLRSTSVYLVEKVVPMLPRLLCEQLCSLNSGEDRLTFSVVWKMNEDGEVLEEWFGKTVIRSCAKLSYGHVQEIIDEPNESWQPERDLPVSNDVLTEEVTKRVLQLYKLSRKLLKKRTDSGTLRLDQAKLSFFLSPESGLPLGWSTYERLESHSLVEEFMLLANMAVAHKIQASREKTTLLRRHPPPQTKMLDEFLTFCESHDIGMDGRDAGSLQRSLIEACGEDDFKKLQVLVALCSRCMQQALYFSSCTIADPSDWRHYALNVPLYTHFTSPIRRYPDILVHRQLAKALELPDYRISTDVQALEKQCRHSNDKKIVAKSAGDKSVELYLSLFIQKCGPMEEEGIVMAVLDRSFDIFVSKIKAVRRVYCEKMPLDRFCPIKDGKKLLLKIVWTPNEISKAPFEQMVGVFTKFRCIISASSELLKWNLEVKHPLDTY